MHIIIKKSEPKVDPRKPETHPGYEDAVRVSRMRAPRMQFESEGARMDYERQLRANPNNLPGLPPFYPPLELRSVTGNVWGTEYDDEQQRKLLDWKMKEATRSEVVFLCEYCDTVTPHAIDMEGSFCKKCGHLKTIHH